MLCFLHIRVDLILCYRCIRILWPWLLYIEAT
jgi:hypothetical protein